MPSPQFRVYVCLSYSSIWISWMGIHWILSVFLLSCLIHAVDVITYWVFPFLTPKVLVVFKCRISLAFIARWLHSLLCCLIQYVSLYLRSLSGYICSFCKRFFAHHELLWLLFYWLSCSLFIAVTVIPNCQGLIFVSGIVTDVEIF